MSMCVTHSHTHTRDERFCIRQIPSTPARSQFKATVEGMCAKCHSATMPYNRIETENTWLELELIDHSIVMLLSYNFAFKPS